MQGIFFESPWFLGAIGTVSAFLAGFGWVQTGNKYLGYAGIGLVLLTALATFINFQFETDRERISGILHDAAGAVKRNDFPELFKHLHPNAPEANRVRQELPRFEFSYARVSRIRDIQINHDTNPPTAIAEFTAVAKGQLSRYP